MTSVVKMTYGHLEQIKSAKGLFQDIDLQTVGPALLSVGVSFAMMSDGATIGCGGVVPRWRGVGEVWIAVADELRARPLLLVRETLRCINMIHKHGGFHRLQMNIQAQDTGLQRWAESLGFTFEGVMKQYGADKLDHHLYARIF
jgi:hypothetical protein